MIKSILLSLTFLLVFSISKGQTTAMNFNKMDCSGAVHNLFADLDAGNAVIIEFYMPSCGSCPPPAKKMQTMANNIMRTYPGKVKAYAFPFNNTTTCSYSASWTSGNGLPLFMPMDSGAAQVSYYGGFGMPTVVLVGGANHKILFSTLSFSTGDTTIMRDKILGLFTGTGINAMPENAPAFSIYPNPANGNATININVNGASNVMVDITDMTGKQAAVIINEKQSGIITKEFSTSSLPNGIYFVRMIADGKTTTQKLNIIH